MILFPTEKTALRLLPLACEYGMTQLEDKCEHVLVQHTKTLPLAKSSKAASSQKDNPYDFLFQCTVVADQFDRKKLLDQCVHLYSHPDVPIKNVKSTTSISEKTKGRIYESRMDVANSRLVKANADLQIERRERMRMSEQVPYWIDKPVRPSQIGHIIVDIPGSPTRGRKKDGVKPKWSY